MGMNLKTQAARGFKWQVLDLAGKQLLGFVAFTLLAHFVTPKDFGVVGLVSVYLAFVGMMADQGIGTAITQRTGLENAHLNAAFWFNLGCACTLCLLTIVFADAIATLFNDAQLAEPLRLSSLMLVTNASSAVQLAVFSRNLDFRTPVIRNLLANLLGGGVGVYMAIAGHGVWALIGQQLTGSVIGAIFVWVTSAWRPSFSFSFQHLRQLIVVSSSVFASNFLWIIATRVDQVLVGKFLGTAVLGQYVIGLKLPELLRTVIQQPLSSVSAPVLFRLQQDRASLCRAIYKGMELNALISIPAFVGLSVISQEIIPLLFGSTWYASVGVCALLSFNSLIAVLGVFIYPALLASGGPGRYVLISIIWSVGIVIACLVGLNFGVYGMMIGMIMVTGFCQVPAYWFLKQRIGLQPTLYFRPCLIPTVASIGMGGAVRFMQMSRGLQSPSLLGVTSQIFVGAIVYSAIVVLLSPRSVSVVREFLGNAFGVIPKKT